MGRSGLGRGGGSSRGSSGSSSHRGSMGRSHSGGGRSGISGRSSFHSGGGYPGNFGRSPYEHRPPYHYHGGGPHVNFYGSGFSFHTSNASPRLVAVVVIALFVMLFSQALFIFLPTNGSITASTVNREPLPAGSVVETDYYTDTAGWITNPSRLEDGMKYFYRETGIQPYVYITEEVDGSRDPSAEQMETFSSALYDQLFTDEAHLLLVFQDADGHYFPWVITGAQAKQVADNEAVTILFDYIDRYYYDSNLNSEDFFSKAFESTADRMMSKTINPMIIVVICITLVVVLIIISRIVMQKIKQKREEDERMERILKTDLSDQVNSSPELKDLEDKYQ